MTDKPLDQIVYEDLRALVDIGIAEGKTIDYKRDTYGSSEADKKELLKDVSSFANTQGGDIYIGIAEAKGLPVSIPGISVANIDSEKLRLEETIRNGIEPRIDFSLHSIETPESTQVLIIRIQESLLAPHRVVFKGKFGEFWARSSAGKFSMDTSELRSAFTLSDSTHEQIRQLRQNRVMQVLRDDTPVPMATGAKLLLHLVPISAFRWHRRFDLSLIQNLSTKFPPLAASGWDNRLNLDGYVTYAGRKEDNVFRSYTQFYRSGMVEAVLGGIVTSNGERKSLTASSYERNLALKYGAVDGFLKALKELEVAPPVWCFLSLIGVKGAVIPQEHCFPDERRDIDRDILLLPEAIIEDLTQPAINFLRPLFDLVWNASGYPRSFNFDEDGSWKGQ